MRTVEEINQYMKEVEKTDFLRTQLNDLVMYLPAEMASEWIGGDFNNEDWIQQPYDRKAILNRMQEYMPFAWQQANNGRGLSASHSMGHYTAWIWLLGDDLGNLFEYQFYGKDNLVRICKFYGWDHTQWDDGIRTN